MLQSKAGYIDARPHIRQLDESSCNARLDHTLGHVWTAPPWQELSELLQHWSGAVMCGRRRLGKNFLSCCSIGRVRSCVRPVLCGGEAAGHNALRGSGPNQKHAFKDALTQTGSPDPGSTLSALRRHVLANSFKLQTPSSFPGLTSLNRSGFDANQSIALRCRRVGAVHSIRLGHSAMAAQCPLCPRKRTWLSAL